MNLKLIEPWKEFFKDEVRILGNSLGLSKKYVIDIHSLARFSNKNYWQYNNRKN